MTNKEWLSRARDIDKEIKALLSERDEAFARCTIITSKLRRDVVSSSSTPQKDSMLIRLSEYDEMLGKAVNELMAAKKEIFQAVSMVNTSTYRTLLYLRYLRFKTWEEIAVEMNYTYRNITYLHGRALNEMSKHCLVFPSDKVI